MTAIREQTFVTLQAEGDPATYKLTFDFNKLCDAETITGVNLGQAMAHLNNLSAAELRAMLLALLKTAHPSATVKDAGELINSDMVAVMAAMAKVFNPAGTIPAEMVEAEAAAE